MTSWCLPTSTKMQTKIKMLREESKHPFSVVGHRTESLSKSLGCLLNSKGVWLKGQS